MSILGHLEPNSVFHFFEEICNIPHGSGNIDKISATIIVIAGVISLYLVGGKLFELKEGE